jgi:hypothetical protein
VAYNFIIDILAKAGEGTKTDTIFEIKEDAGVLSVFGDGEWRALDDEFPRGETWAFLKDPERCQPPTLEPPPLSPFQPEVPPPSQPQVPLVRPPQPQPSPINKPTTRTSPRRTSPPSDSDSDSDSSEEDSEASDDDGPQGGARGEGGKRGGSEDMEAAGDNGASEGEGGGAGDGGSKSNSESEGGGAGDGGSESSSESGSATPPTPGRRVEPLARNESLVRSALASHNLKLKEPEDQEKLYRKKGFTKKDSMLILRDLVRTIVRGEVVVNTVNGGAGAGIGKAPQREADAGGSAAVASIFGEVTAQQAALLRFMEKEQDNNRTEMAGLVAGMMTNMQAMSQKHTDGMQAFARSLILSPARHPTHRIEGERSNPEYVRILPPLILP